jgi:gluconolactonase
LRALIDIDGIELLARTSGSTEGPVWHPAGYLTFVVFDHDELLRWEPAARVATVIADDTQEGNGCALDNDGRVLMCEGGARRVVRIDNDGSRQVLADSWLGKRLNKPNDVLCAADGTIYFTDPIARVPRPQRELDFSSVYLIRPDGSLDLATSECEYPNGLALSADESCMFIAITRRDEECLSETERGDLCPHQRIAVFDVQADGRLDNGRTFADMTARGPGHPDGMALDTDGRVYCTGADGVWVFGPSGARIGIIELPEQARNIAFGGDDLRDLFVTAGESLYRVPTAVTGLPLTGPPPTRE